MYLPEHSHHPCRQTGLQVPGLNCSPPAFFRGKHEPRGLPRAAVPAAPGQTRVLPATRSSAHPPENGSCFRLKRALVAQSSSARCLLPNCSSAPSTNPAGRRLLDCCPPRASGGMPPCAPGRVSFPIWPLLRFQRDFTYRRFAMKEGNCLLLVFSAGMMIQHACSANYLLLPCSTQEKHLLTAMGC